MKTAIMKLSEITPAEYNPRKTLRPGDTEYEALKNSLARFGVAEPLVVNETTGNLVSGHQRLNVLLEMGVEEVEVVLVELDEDQEKLLNIAMNKIEGEWDYKKLEALFSEISAEDIKFTGFSEEELRNLFEDGGDSPDFGDDEPEGSDGAENSNGSEKETVEEKEPPQRDFNIFLSFPTKELAEKWMKDRGIDLEYTGTNRNITIRMEGLDYGAGN
jgi:hypothetical protein